jgi:PAS domain S-box-containing protein
MKALYKKISSYFFSNLFLTDRIREYVIIAFGIILTLLFSAIYFFNPHILRIIDRANYSLMLKILPEDNPDGGPVIVDIDEKSLEKYGQWPWPRYQVAKLLDKIAVSKPSVISLDIIFSEPDRTSVNLLLKGLEGIHNLNIDLEKIPAKFLENDLILAETLGKGPFVLSHQFKFDKLKKNSFNSLIKPVNVSILHDTPDEKEIIGLPESFNVLSNLKIFSEKVEASGFSNFTPDNDGVLRRIPLLIRYHENIYPSLALATILKYKKINSITLKTDKDILHSISFKGTSIPVDPQGNLMIRFHGSRMNYEYISAADILDDIVAPEKLERRIVFVGTSAYGLENLQTTPFGPMCPGVEVHAAVVDNILSGDFIFSPGWSGGAVLLIIILLGTVLSFLIVLRSNGFSLIIMIIFISGLWLASQQALHRAGYFIEITYPMVSVLSIYIFMIIFKYLLEKSRAINALKESEIRFRTLFKNAPIPMCYISCNNKIIGVNNSFTEILGYSPDDIPTLSDAINTAFKDTEIKNEEMSKWLTGLKIAITENRSIETRECQVLCKDGSIRTMIIDGESMGNSFIISLFDITKRKQEEAYRERLQAQLLQSQKLEAVGSLAGGIAHDFNNMLSIIMGYSEMAILQTEATSKVNENLFKILDAAKRSANLTRQLLGFARKQMIQPVVLDLNKSIENILEMLRRLIGENIDLIWFPCPKLCTVMMDPSQLDQVLLNLCVNSKDAITNVGKITIELSIKPLDESLPESETEIKYSEYVCLTVIDTGCGMNEETQRHIFEPFFTTKELGHGTGMGLATVYGIVKQNQGFIRLSSILDKGTTFKIFFPRYSDKVSDERISTTAVVGKSKKETILIVEDDLSILQLMKAMLETFDYVVFETTNPVQALEIAHKYKKEIDLLLTDMIMPGMNGRDLAEKVLAIQPDIKILFMSGYAHSILSAKDKDGHKINFIQKPFSMKDMALKIREVLDEN